MTGTPDTDLIFINEEFYSLQVSPKQLDIHLASGWRHFGTYFFRYSLALYHDEVRRVMPLRVRLADFRLSKSQRRVLNKNGDVKIKIRPTRITAESEDLFERHKQRFDHGTPNSIYDFLSSKPDTLPCFGRELAVYRGKRLIAVSYFDLGATAISGIYAAFDPDESDRSLGTFTMLKEIEFAAGTEREFYYQGYAYEGSSFYDYKKRLSGTEVFDWRGNWDPLSE